MDDSSTVDNVDPSIAIDTYSESYLTAHSAVDSNKETATELGPDSIEISDSDSDENNDEFRSVSARPFPLPQLDALNKVSPPPPRLLLSFCSDSVYSGAGAIFRHRRAPS